MSVLGQTMVGVSNAVSIPSAVTHVPVTLATSWLPTKRHVKVGVGPVKLKLQGM